jgi:hypothetical protein
VGSETEMGREREIEMVKEMRVDKDILRKT